MPNAAPNHYQLLGLDHDCTTEDIKAAYRFLAKENHPDLNPDSEEARLATQRLNEAYQTLSHPVRRSDYDRQLRAAKPGTSKGQGRLSGRSITIEAVVSVEQLIQGGTINVRVDQWESSNAPETCVLHIPAMTPPGTRFRIDRPHSAGGGIVHIRVRALPEPGFRPSGSDLKCNLNIPTALAHAGGTRSLEGPTGRSLEVVIPPNVPRGTVIAISGEGLPKARGGRGDLLVRITYRSIGTANIA